MNPLDPCKLCLVRTMCREACGDLLTYVVDAVNRVAADPNDDVLDQFNPEQRRLLETAAETLRRNRLKMKGPEDGK